MSTLQTIKYATKSQNLHLRVATGHFATNSLHSNYYIDVAAHSIRGRFETTEKVPYINLT